MKSLSSVLLVLVLSVSFGALPVEGQAPSYRNNFVKLYKGFKYEDLAKLVQKTRDIIPGEVASLIKDGQDAGTYEEKMYFLDLANTMIYMYSHWHGSNAEMVKYEHTIASIIKRESRREKKRIDQLMKWKKEEKFLGNFVMKSKMSKMKSEGLPPVLYPHWVHRIWFKCKVCHETIFEMKRWTNDISHSKFKEGKQCAACHNGSIAFSTDKDADCKRCHLAGTPKAKPLYSTGKMDHKKIQAVARKVGAEWHPEKLKTGKLPLDRFKYVDWMALINAKVINPVGSLDKDYKDEVRENKILFENRSKSVKNVVFDHGIHTNLIKCSVCHPLIFKEELGSNKMKMTDLAAGKFCGRCHGKVSFTFADCKKCHNQPKNEMVKGALIHRISKKK